MKEQGVPDSACQVYVVECDERGGGPSLIGPGIYVMSHVGSVAFIRRSGLEWEIATQPLNFLSPLQPLPSRHRRWCRKIFPSL